MNDTKEKNISFLFIIINSITFFAGIFFLIQNLRTACAVSFLLCALNFVFYQIYAFSMQDRLAKALSQEASSSSLPADMEEQLNHLSKNCEKLKKQNHMLKKQLKSYEEKLSESSLFYHCPLTAATPINLNKFLSSYFKEHAPQFQEARINASMQTDNVICETLLSSSALTLICNNLLDNSLKFTPAGGTLLVTLTKNENDILIIWKNTGDGISEADTSKVFDLNYRNSPIGKGTGLGLTQVKAIVADYGGCVWVKSTKGNGFAVYLQLPFKPKGENTL